MLWPVTLAVVVELAHSDANGRIERSFGTLLNVGDCIQRFGGWYEHLDRHRHQCRFRGVETRAVSEFALDRFYDMDGFGAADDRGFLAVNLAGTAQIRDLFRFGPGRDSGRSSPQGGVREARGTGAAEPRREDHRDRVYDNRVSVGI